ncbi:hypothetical protein GRS96_20380 (plasmid) [Rathayibacter sp. VKM Ac-2803]|uniref:hypothetical protein n=1 Tax=Rathayibacter sp. VKM Ac-2803 TaxID=2609256 RepID=UPI00135A38FB|nr:hypothetical protein [Rathayibacter sp. VKM Ac-2803]MWV51625.1 hypothetical protein [Rathayibacter sp. VKM Ac-2803]
MSSNKPSEPSTPDPITTKSSDTPSVSGAPKERFREQLIAEEYDSLGDGAHREMLED